LILARAMGDAGSTRKRRRKPKTASGRRRAENRRLRQLLETEESFWDRGFELVAGVDEAGRGPLAGPVLAAAVILPPRVGIRGVDDSKKLTAEERERLFVEIREKAVCISVGAASSREVDRLNILRASHVAMRRAVQRLKLPPQQVIVDGLPVPLLGDGHMAIVDGDAKVHCIACASVVAKVVRDRLMRQLAPRYPGYGWDHNVGYATQDHRDAILSLGLTPHHRRSFEPNFQLTLDLLT
jgi:ribonuclease HII